MRLIRRFVVSRVDGVEDVDLKVPVDGEGDGVGGRDGRKRGKGRKGGSCRFVARWVGDDLHVL